MEQLQQYINTILASDPHRLIISKGKLKSHPIIKVAIHKKDSGFQIEKFTETQAFHENIVSSEIGGYLIKLLENDFSQLNAFCDDLNFSIGISKKGKFLFNKSKGSAIAVQTAEHNRSKNYILKEGVVVQPLVDMGVMTSDGKVIASMYDKFKQINRFIEMIDDSVKLKNFTRLRVIDFGCGKSYLTFVLYHFLHNIRCIDVAMIGLDLKKDVIDKCNATAKKYNYSGLSFELGDIKDYLCDGGVDMVISLHACDTATDLALFNAINWGAEMIFSVPCCQHEINEQINSEQFSITTRYGIVKERISALYTDAIRANLLQCCGYKTQLLEFVDFEHTPKNILIRAVKSNIPKAKRNMLLNEVLSLISEFNLSPTLYNLLNKNILKVE